MDFTPHSLSWSDWNSWRWVIILDSTALRITTLPKTNRARVIPSANRSHQEDTFQGCSASGLLGRPPRAAAPASWRLRAPLQSAPPATDGAARQRMEHHRELHVAPVRL